MLIVLDSVDATSFLRMIHQNSFYDDGDEGDANLVLLSAGEPTSTCDNYFCVLPRLDVACFESSARAHRDA